jgi:type I restriction enzyme S subunit
MKSMRLVDSELKITQEGLDNGSRLAPESSILILVRGSELHHRIPIGFATRELAFNQDIKALRAAEGLLPEYLLYWLLGNEELLKSKVEYTGIGAGKLDTDVLKGLNILLPPPAEQQAIAHILGTLDDKIELNRRMNETLENIARALFKSWFIDFDPVRAKAEGKQPFGMDEKTAALFPSEFEDSELGEIPKGWEIKRLGDFIDIDKGLSYKGEYLSNDGAPLINLGNIVRLGGFNPSGIKFYIGEYKPKHVVKPGDVVLANTDITQDREVIGSPAIVPDYWGENDYLFTHHIFSVRPKSWLSRIMVYYLLQSPRYRERAEGYATGTTVLALPKDAVLDYKFAVPPEWLHDMFMKTALSLYQLKIANNKNILILSSISDALLPKLLSGKLRVSDSQLSNLQARIDASAPTE